MLLGLIAGIAAGLLTPEVSSHPIVAAVGELWFNGLRMTVIPIVVAQLLLGMNLAMAGREIGGYGIRALGWYLALLTTAAVCAAVWTTFFVRFLPTGNAPATAPVPAAVPGFAAWVTGLLPSNLVRAAGDGQLLPLILAAILVGAALRKIDTDRSEALLQVVAALNDAMLVVVRWILLAAPFGIAALTAGAIAKAGAAMAGAFGLYVVYFSALLLFLTLIVYLPAAPVYGMRHWAAAIAQAQALAFSTRSSMATLPAMIDCARERLRLSPAAFGFVLPFGVSVFRYTTPAAQVCGAIFVAHLYGIPVGPAAMGLLVATSVLLSFSAPGIPSSGLLVALPLFQQLGLPAEGLGMLVAADAIPDMFKTMANVTGHLAVASVTGRPEAPAPRNSVSTQTESGAR